MKREDLIRALRSMQVETGSLVCLGCGHERGCSIHGCAILRKTVDRLKESTALPPNPPLTLEELREMDGFPVWVEMLIGRIPSHYAIIHGEFVHDGRFRDDKNKCLLSLTESGGYGLAWLAYRRKPEVEQ